MTLKITAVINHSFNSVHLVIKNLWYDWHQVVVFWIVTSESKVSLNSYHKRSLERHYTTTFTVTIYPELSRWKYEKTIFFHTLFINLQIELTDIFRFIERLFSHEINFWRQFSVCGVKMENTSHLGQKLLASEILFQKR